jgi:hypothetical protein
VVDIIESRAVQHVDNEMRSGISYAVTLTEVVFSFLAIGMRNSKGMLFFRLGGA